MQELTLGKALALLDLEDSENSIEWRRPADLDMQGLDKLRQRLTMLKACHEVPNVVDSFLTRPPCQDNFCIASDVDFFLLCLIMRQQPDHDLQEISRRIAHVNSCFRCFEEFAQVMSDYYYYYRWLTNVG